MKILQVHNYYKLPGGEDTVVKNEKELLLSKGHDVIEFTKTNKEIDHFSLYRKLRLLSDTTFSKRIYYEITKLLDKIKPDICHVHNFVPLISPAIFYACKGKRIPVVQTLHNYRLLCSNAYLFRNGKLCEECLGKSLYNSLKYGCYRNSRIQTFAIACMVEKHKKLGTWNNCVDAYICLTEFAKKKFIEGGLPKEKLFVKPNFIRVDEEINYTEGEYFFYMGRLDETKGISVLVDCFKNLEKITLIVAGNGPLKRNFENISKNIIFLGHIDSIQIKECLKNSVALIFPSVWYEGMPMSIIESFSMGKPVIASNLGAMSEMIEDGKTGLLFEPGISEDLISKVNWAIGHKEKMKQMGINAIKVYEEKYTPEKNYQLLMNIYHKVIENNKFK